MTILQIIHWWILPLFSLISIISKLLCVRFYIYENKNFLHDMVWFMCQDVDRYDPQYFSWFYSNKIGIFFLLNFLEMNFMHGQDHMLEFTGQRVSKEWNTVTVSFDLEDMSLWWQETQVERSENNDKAQISKDCGLPTHYAFSSSC